MPPETLLKILSSEEAPRIDTLATIFHALGCRLSITPLSEDDTKAAAKRESTHLKNVQTQLSESDSPQEQRS